MATQALSRENIELGRSILLVTEALGMSVEGAFWIYDRNEKGWDYFIVSSLFETIGAKQLYKKLDAALVAMLSEAEAKAARILISGPNEEVIRAVRAAVETAPLASHPMEVDVSFNGHLTTAYVYRMTRRMNAKEVRSARGRFNRRFSQLEVA